MKRAWRTPMPLLVKELSEQAARRRTYVLRVSLAVLFYAIFLWILAQQLYHQRDPSSILGWGRELFGFVLVAQFTAVFVVLPAMMSGVITYEKERDSLALLLLTDLRPREILVQKYLGRLIPMFVVLGLSLPLLGMAYALGGITTTQMSTGVFTVLLACFQVGAIALMVSAWCRTTAAAFVAAYLVGGAFYLFPVVIAIIADNADWHWLPRWLTQQEFALALLPPFIYQQTYDKSLTDCVRRSIPTMLTIPLFLLLARAFLVRRAFTPSRRLLLRLFRRLDAFWTRLNQKWAGGILVWREKDTLPDDEPIAWREVNKKSLGRATYLLRIVVLFDLPAVVVGGHIAFFAFPAGYGRQLEALSGYILFLWALAALLVTVLAANFMAAERTRQTLDVLLTLPISGRDLLRQKMRGLRRFMIVLALPLALLTVVEAAVERVRYGAVECAGYALTALLLLVVYMPMFAWVACWIGLKMRSRARAIIVAVIVLAVWTLGPILLLGFLDEVNFMHTEQLPVSLGFLFSPAVPLLGTEFMAWRNIVKTDALSGSVASILLYTGVLLVFRALCLKKADHYLGRAVRMDRPAILARSEVP